MTLEERLRWAETALAASQARLEAILKTEPECIKVISPEGHLIEMNPAGLAMLDADSLAMAQCQPLLDYLRPEYRAAFADLHRRVLAGENASLELEITSLRGVRRWLATRAAPLRDERGDITAVLGITRDITARKQAEEALRESEAFLGMSQEAGQSGSWEWVLGSDMVKWSAQMCRIHGVEPAQFPGTLAAAFGFVHPDDLSFMNERMGQLLATHQFRETEYRIFRADGTERTLWSRGRMVLDAAGQPVRVLGTVTDITERKRAEESLRLLEARMQQAQKLESLGLLAGGIAHDFNNLLTAILGYADLALLDLAASPARECIEQVVAGTRRAAELTNQMLAYSGKSSLLLQSVHLSDLVRQMAELLKVSVSRQAVLYTHLAPSLPSVQGDPVQLRQVVMNLILNASEALEERPGTVTVATRVFPWPGGTLPDSYPVVELASGSYVCLEVADTGCGMNSETRARLFDPFFTTKFTGRGLGLAAVLGIVRGHGGAIQVHSTPGGGTTFRVYFPAEGEPPLAETASAAASPWRGSGTMLIVDDEAVIRDLAARMLRSLGFEVVTARDGREAIALYRAAPERFAAVLLDLTMPGLNGVETLRELRRLHPGVRVILSSGYGDSAEAGHWRDERPAGFVPKPYRLEELNRVLRAVLEGAPG